MSETDIVWASGEVGSGPFFTRSEFEQFSCEYKLHDQILKKEKELHPGGPVFGTTKTPELPSDNEVSQDTENGQQPSKETNIATTESGSHACEETESETAKTSVVHVKSEPTKTSSNISKSEDDTKKAAKKTKPVKQPEKTEKPVNTPASTANKPPVWVVEENEAQEEVVGPGFAGPHTAHQPYQPRFPRTSWLTMEEHRAYLQLHKKCTGPAQHNKTPATTKELQRYKELHQKVTSEQEEFLVFTESEAARRPIAYRRIQPDAARFTDVNKLLTTKMGIPVHVEHIAQYQLPEYLGCLCDRVSSYPRFFVQQDSVPLIDKNTPFVPLVHVKCLLKMGEVPRAIMPIMESFKKPRLPVDYNRITNMFPITQSLNRKPTCSQDTNAEKLAMKYSAEMVMSASTIKCLLDHGNNMERQWELAVVVKEHVIEDVRGKRTVKVVYVDKPFPPKTMLTAQKNAWFHKFAMKSLILHRNHDNRHIFSKRHHPKANKEDEYIEDTECDLDNLETFGVVSKQSERRPSAFKKYVRPEGIKSPTDGADVAPPADSNPEGDNSVVTDTTTALSPKTLDIQDEPVNGKGFSRSGSQGFIPTVISPRLPEQTLLKGLDEAAVETSKPGDKGGESTEKERPGKSGSSQGEEKKPTGPHIPPPTADKDHSPSDNKTAKNNENQPVKGDSETTNPILQTQIDAKDAVKDAAPNETAKESAESAESPPLEMIPENKMATDDTDTPCAGSQTPSQEAPKGMKEGKVVATSSGPTEVKMEAPLDVHSLFDQPMPTDLETAMGNRRRSCRLALSKTDLATLQGGSEPRIRTRKLKRCASEDVNTKYNETKGTAAKTTAGVGRQDPGGGAQVCTDDSDPEQTLVIDIPEDSIPKTRRGGRRSGRLLATASTENEPAIAGQDHEEQGSEKDISKDGEAVSDSKKEASTAPGQGSAVGGGVADDSDAEGLVIDIPEEVKEAVQPKRGRGRPRKAQTTPKATQPRPVSPKPVKAEEVTTPSAAGEEVKRVTRSQRASVVTDSVNIPVTRKRKSIVPTESTTQPPEELKSPSPFKRTKNSPEEKEEKPLASPSDSQRNTIKDLDLDKSHFSLPLQHGLLQDSPFSPFLQDEDVLPVIPLSPPPLGKGLKSRGSSVSESPHHTDLPFSPHPPGGSSNRFCTPFSPGSQYSSDSILSPFVQGHFKFAESPLSPYPHGNFHMADSPLSPCPEKHARDKDKHKSHFGAIHDVKIIPLSPMYSSRELKFNLDAHVAESQKDDPSSDQAKSRRGSIRRASNVALPPQGVKKDARGTDSAPSAPLSTLDQIMQAQESFLKPPTVKVEQEKAKPETSEPKVEAAAPSVAASIQKDPAEWMPSESPADYETYDQDNLTYNLWLLGDIRLIIRCGVHGVVKHKKRTQFVSLTPKMEFQPAFGLEQVMPGESARNWVDFHIRHVDKLVRVRVNAYNSEVLMMDQLTMGDIVNAKSLFNPLTATSRLHCVLEKLKSLPVGHYLLGHSPGNAHAHIKKSVSSTSGVYDLHKAYLDRPVGVINDDRLPWIPIDPTIQLFQHQKHQRIPATFVPKDSPEAAGSTWGGKSQWQGQQNRKKKSGKKKKKKQN